MRADDQVVSGGSREEAAKALGAHTCAQMHWARGSAAARRRAGAAGGGLHTPARGVRPERAGRALAGGGGRTRAAGANAAGAVSAEGRGRKSRGAMQ